ncbi:hypothetical protein CHS0354_038333 [Potamilus streckersoni]|uniref:VWFD domain-containing protein n=1 Tax=Potamilus streckersoni TaxID=2493646 RepID=A0AAE0S5M5_9BIVA|nr:hypothetical protein CHS0354_038333 [Potamilus streckersoni]
MNVAIYLSKKDEERIEGLCGSFNNNQMDDFVIRQTGAITQDNDHFSLSWKITAAESFLSQSNHNPGNWDIKRLLCVCPNATLTQTRSLINSSVCSPDESVLCTRKPQQGKDVVRCRYHDIRPTSRSFQEMSRRVKRATQHIQYPGKVGKSVGNISLEDAETACATFFSASPNYKLQNNLPINTLNNSIHECALDYQMSEGDISWAAPHLQSWTNNIETQISRDKIFQEDHANIMEEFLANACPNQCNNNGHCDNGTCVCDNGFASSDCSINVMSPPPVNDIYNDGQCDTSTDNCCSGFSIYGDDFIRSESLECRVEETEVDVNGSVISLEPVVHRAEFVSLFELICPVRCKLPSKSAQRPMATVYNLSVSNFGQNFGARQSMFVYDHRCTTMEVDRLAIVISTAFAMLMVKTIRATAAKPALQSSAVKSGRLNGV